MEDPPTGDEDRTRVSLLIRAAGLPRDDKAWEEFHRVYGGLIGGWCRRWGLQEADAEDASQAVLIEICRALPGFQYDRSRSFRAWLKTAAHHACGRVASRLNRPGRGSGDDEAFDRLASLEARDDLADRLQGEYDLELLEEAKARVRRRVGPKTWEAFQLLADEDRPGEEVAARLGMTPNAAYKARSNVLRMLRAEVREIEEAKGDA